MEVQLVMGEAVDRKLYYYTMRGFFMHGDADADTSTELVANFFDVEEVEDLKKVVKAYELYLRESNTNYRLDHDKMVELMGEETVLLLNEIDMWPLDVFSNYERYARLQNYTITFAAFDGDIKVYTEVTE